MLVNIQLTHGEILIALVEYLVTMRGVPREIASTVALQIPADKSTWREVTMSDDLRAVAFGSTNESFATGPYR